MTDFRTLVTSIVAALQLLALPIAPSTATAQVPTCFDAEGTPGWDPGNLGTFTVGSSRVLPPNGFELCSAAAGLAPSEDAWRYLIQRVNDDFAFGATLASIDDIGSAGVAVRRDARKPDSAYIAIHASVLPSGSWAIRSSVRSRDGGAASAGGSAEVVIAPPVRLRIVRSGSSFTTFYAQGADPFVPHLTSPTTGSDLDANPVAVGLLQASGDGATPATASFSTAGFEVDPAPRADASGCMEGFVAPVAGVSTFSLDGHFLDRVDAVTIGGRHASIVSASPTRIVVEAPQSPAGIGNAQVSIVSGGETRTLPARLVWAGEPFVRGDVNGDGNVNRRDIRRLRHYLAGSRPWLSCFDAADVNADQSIDGGDLDRLAGFLDGSLPAPSAPFPTPGFLPGGQRSCGLPPPPRVYRLRDANGRPLPAGAPLQQGDIVTIKGRSFPAEPARSIVNFGNVRTRVLQGSTPRSLRLEIGPVPDAGTKCPVVLVDTAVTPATTQATAETGQITAFGLSYAVLPGTGRDDLCPDFVASTTDAVSVASHVPDSHSLFLPIDRAWDRSRPLDVQVSLYLPLVDGVSRGSRIVRLQHRRGADPADPDAPSTYEPWLRALAARLTEQLNGGRADDCACDAKAEADVVQNGLLISPCDQTLGWLDPDPTPDPPAPPKSYPLKNPRQPFWGADAFANPEPPIPLGPPCWDRFPLGPVVGIPSPKLPTLSREFQWCNFVDLTRKAKGLPLPRFEYFIPVSTLLGGPGAINKLGLPDTRSPAQKGIMFSTDAYTHAFNEGYPDPCAAAARRFYCKDDPGQFVSNERNWMPDFPKTGHVVKTFWLAYSKLPANADPDDYYSYQPPNGERQYLAGMHIATGTGEFARLSSGFRAYFAYATFFVPKPPGDTKRRDGTALYYNGNCTQGSFDNRLPEVQGVWQNYVMCSGSQDSDGSAACGNPWGPPDECTTFNSLDGGACYQCHASLDGPQLDLGGSWPFHMGWLPSLTNSKISQCYDKIVAADEEGVALYKSLAPDDCLP